MGYTFHRQKLQKAVITLSINESYELNDGGCYRIRRLEENLYQSFLPKNYPCEDVITYHWNQSRDYNVRGHFNFYYSIACMILVKRDRTVPYNALDKLSILLNILICLTAIPFMTFSIILMQIVVSVADPAYQIALCVPAITAFTLAASVALRRIRFTKTGFFLPFAGPALFVLTLILSE